MRKIYTGITITLVAYTGLVFGNLLHNYLGAFSATRKSEDKSYSVETRQEFRDYAELLKKETEGFEILNPFDDFYRRFNNFLPEETNNN